LGCQVKWAIGLNELAAFDSLKVYGISDAMKVPMTFGCLPNRLISS
jgi:hypothetical protein